MEVKRRVKVYQLDPSGKWDDKGTGHVSCSTGMGGLTILVQSEEDGSTILETRVFDENSYQRQQDTLILWTDPTTNIDLALSFQEPDGCQEIWETITNDSDILAIVEPTVENLAQISDIIDPLSPSKEKIAMSLCREDYIKQLLDLFDLVEPNQDKEQLFHFFHIFKNIILMNETSLFETILSDEFILRVMGPLEYDPDISEQNRIKHRDFLNNHVVFKEVVKFTEQQQNSILPIIHQTFRVQYLKDVVLPRVLDDLTFATLNSIIYFNNSEIITLFLNDPSLLHQVITKIEISEPSSKEKIDSLLFFQELCGIAKGLQPTSKIHFFSTITDNDDVLFKTLKIAIDDENPQCRLSCTEIILSILQFDARVLRNYISTDSSFFSKLISRFINDSDIGVKNQIAEIIKILVEAESNELIIRADNISNTFESPEVTCNTSAPRNERELDEEEESYFRDDSDDSDNDNDSLSDLKYYNMQQQQQQQKGVKVVDYDSDEEDFILTSIKRGVSTTTTTTTADNNNNNSINTDDEMTDSTNTDITSTSIFEQLEQQEQEQQDTKQEQELKPSSEEEQVRVEPVTEQQQHSIVQLVVDEKSESESVPKESGCNKEPDETTVCNGANHKSIQKEEEEEVEEEKDSNVQINHKQQQQEQEDKHTTSSSTSKRVIKRKSIETSLNDQDDDLDSAEYNNNNNNTDDNNNNNNNNNSNNNGDMMIDSNHVDAKILKSNNHDNNNNSSNSNNNSSSSGNNEKETTTDDLIENGGSEQQHRTIKRVKIKDNTAISNNNNDAPKQQQQQQPHQCAIVDSKE
ncbi:EVH1 domain-containing protein [Cavenderia fasciculata]|uniref:EVH1 domain-containing protein n=1 Tax=Cavenderia fasciculata TaxID=261658 RepID=F4PGY3_CACFS|nr:EVH1 domain-containing protein [Cavenderia fasciculata]EGG24967.1 EVH1 domain-containing protein [Cavenderia fasciculata]|eukprot:XP_004362818.1 EVH1 domain-containing protein [Cavenderia fasciculata]